MTGSELAAVIRPGVGEQLAHWSASKLMEQSDTGGLHAVAACAALKWLC